MSSVKKTNAELHRLDSEIRLNIQKAHSAGNRAMVLVSAQAPVHFRASLSGISGGDSSKKKPKKHHKKRR